MRATRQRHKNRAKHRLCSGGATGSGDHIFLTKVSIMKMMDFVKVFCDFLRFYHLTKSKKLQISFFLSQIFRVFGLLGDIKFYILYKIYDDFFTFATGGFKVIREAWKQVCGVSRDVCWVWLRRKCAGAVAKKKDPIQQVGSYERTLCAGDFARCGERLSLFFG